MKRKAHAPIITAHRTSALDDDSSLLISPGTLIWRLAFERRRVSRSAAMQMELEDLTMGFRPLDFRGCMRMIRKFSGLTDEEIVARSGISAKHLTYLEAHGSVNVQAYYALMDIAHEFYLPADVEKWFDREARIKESKKRPSLIETMMGERK